jgi:hypothetical protein
LDVKQAAVHHDQGSLNPRLRKRMSFSFVLGDNCYAPAMMPPIVTLL